MYFLRHVKRGIFVLLLNANIIIFSEAQQVTITGHASSYSGSELTFYFYPDWITNFKEVAGKCQVAENGDFSLDILLPATRQIVTDLGIYKGYFFAVPGRTYQIVLPEKTDKKPEDELNPYFEQEEIHLGIDNVANNDLNLLIAMFDNTYFPYFNKHVENVYAKADNKRLDEDIQKMDEPFKENADIFFREYRRYRFAMLKLFANQQKVQSLSDEYFNNQPVLYDNPAYGDLFNRVFDKYFVFFGRSDSGKKIYSDINQNHSLGDLLETLSVTDDFSNDTLTELVILKQIHDEYYSNNFSRNGLLEILDSISVTTSNKNHQLLCRHIMDKLTKLQSGYEPPQFELQDVSGKMIKLSDFKGKYVYLNFCTCQSYACLNEFNLLTQLNKQHKDKLVILTITTDPVDDAFKQFLIKNNYDWTFLHYNNQPEILKDYDIRTFPTYFLIGPDGKLIYSPAASPSENFELKLFDVMKARGEL
jgi:peroxiredoxin